MRIRILLACLMLVSLPLYAQTTTNPKTVTFNISPDHSTNGLDGNPLVARYELRMYVQTGMVQFSVTDLGKPVPTAGLITVTNPIWFAGLTPNTIYIAKVAAIGPSGEGVSTNSNPFGNVGPPMPPTALILK